MKKLFVLVPCMIVASMTYSADVGDKLSTILVYPVYYRGKRATAAPDLEFKVDLQNTTVGSLVNAINKHSGLANNPKTADLSVQSMNLKSNYSPIDLDNPDATLSEIGLLEGQAVFAELEKKGEYIKGD